jgi:hypothetical protein
MNRPMNPTIREDISGPSHWAPRPAVLACALGAGALVAGTGALWARYGTAVFYETILAGLNACF